MNNRTEYTYLSDIEITCCDSTLLVDVGHRVWEIDFGIDEDGRAILHDGHFRDLCEDPKVSLSDTEKAELQSRCESAAEQSVSA